MIKEFAQHLRGVFNTPDLTTAESYLVQVVQKYETWASRLANWMEQAIPEGFSVFAFPVEHRRRLRTINMLERLS